MTLHSFLVAFKVSTGRIKIVTLHSTEVNGEGVAVDNLQLYTVACAKSADTIIRGLCGCRHTVAVGSIAS
jgi:hypothetical protein